MDNAFDKEAYAAEFGQKLAQFSNHPLNYYQPKNFKFMGLGGQSKVLSFYSETAKKELVVKIYPAVFYSDAKNEFDNMKLLVHENILQVIEFRTIYVDDEKKGNSAKDKPSDEEDESGDSDGSGSLQLDGDSSDDGKKKKDDDGQIKEKGKSKKEKGGANGKKKEDDSDDGIDDEGTGGQNNENDEDGAQHANILIIMEKADKPLSRIINQRKKNKKPFTAIELLEFWKKIINVFAFCTRFKITHHDIKPSNILLTRNEATKAKKETDINTDYIPKISDFGTSIQVGDGQKASNAEAMYNNTIAAMTPSYASPNVLQQVPKINHYLEDVFSLGITFLQMAGLFSEKELNKYGLNRSEVLYHSVQSFIGISKEEYNSLDAAEAQQLRA